MGRRCQRAMGKAIQLDQGGSCRTSLTPDQKGLFSGKWRSSRKSMADVFASEVARLKAVPIENVNEISLVLAEMMEEGRAMLTKAQIVERCRKPLHKTDDHELRKLPYKEAYIYGRVSAPGQMRSSKESIREIAKLVKLAIDDGYKTNLVPEQVEEWLEWYQHGDGGQGCPGGRRGHGGRSGPGHIGTAACRRQTRAGLTAATHWSRQDWRSLSEGRESAVYPATRTISCLTNFSKC